MQVGVVRTFLEFLSTETLRIPDYAPEEFREAAKEESRLAVIGNIVCRPSSCRFTCAVILFGQAEELPARAAEWEKERADADSLGRKPDLSIKFAYAWTLTKSAGSTEARLGRSLLRGKTLFAAAPSY